MCERWQYFYIALECAAIPRKTWYSQGLMTLSQQAVSFPLDLGHRVQERSQWFMGLLTKRLHGIRCKRLGRMFHGIGQSKPRWHQASRVGCKEGATGIFLGETDGCNVHVWHWTAEWKPLQRLCGVVTNAACLKPAQQLDVQFWFQDLTWKLPHRATMLCR